MQRSLLAAKLHRACVTHSELDYEGSCAIDIDLLRMSGILPYEEIQIYNITNGERFTTYAIEAEAGSGVISINGAAAHKAHPGDRVIICAYVLLDSTEITQHQPVLVYMDENNKVTGSRNAIPVQAA